MTKPISNKGCEQNLKEGINQNLQRFQLNFITFRILEILQLIYKTKIYSKEENLSDYLRNYFMPKLNMWISVCSLMMLMTGQGKKINK